MRILSRKHHSGLLNNHGHIFGYSFLINRIFTCEGFWGFGVRAGGAGDDYDYGVGAVVGDSSFP